MTADELTIQLKTARGKRYYDILKAICSLIAADFSRDVATLRAYYGGLSPVGIGILALHYDLNYKATIFALEAICQAPSGLYDKIVTYGGWRVGDILAAARAMVDSPVMPISRWQKGT